MSKTRVQVDLDNKDATLLALLEKRLAVRSRADLLQQAYGTFIWVVDEMLAGRHIISVDGDSLETVARFKELNLPAVAPLLYRHYQHLTARPETGRSQLYLKGRTMTVGQLVYKMRANELNAEAAAADMDLPLEQVLEALAYYETHRDLIENEAAEEQCALLASGVDLEPAPVS